VEQGADGVSDLRPIVPGNLRPAPAELTPQLVDRFLSLADALATPKSPLDASVAPSGRTAGDVQAQAPLIAAAEAGRGPIVEKRMPPEQMIIAAMRGATDTHWTMATLAKAASLSASDTKATVQKMRWSGKMQFDRLALSPSLLADGIELPAPVVTRPARQFVGKQITASDGARFKFKVNADAEETAGPAFLDRAAQRPSPTVEPVATNPRSVAAALNDEDRALQVLVADYRRPTKPAFVSCYLRLCDWAKAEGIVLPSSSTMRRRLYAAIEQRSSAVLAELPVAKPISIEAECQEEAPIAEPVAITAVVEPASAAAVPAVALPLEPAPVVEAEPTPEPAPRLSIADQVAAEAEEAGRRRRTARTLGHTSIVERAPASAGEAIAIAIGEDIDGATNAIKRNWPDLWWRVVQRSRLTGERPGAALAEVVERGLDSFLVAQAGQ
jgi:hypothetical protein